MKEEQEEQSQATVTGDKTEVLCQNKKDILIDDVCIVGSRGASQLGGIF